jgi:RNA polymerase sigma-70 factor (ECF subfamily)
MQQHGIRPWLFKILHNVVNARFGKQRRDEKLIDGLRQQAAGAQSQHDSDGTPAAGDGVASEAVAFDGVPWDGVDERLKQAIELLPFNNKVVFLLSAVEQMRYREIADLIGVPIGTVMSRLHRARATLAAQLRELAGERGLSAPPPSTGDGRTANEIKRGP